MTIDIPGLASGIQFGQGFELVRRLGSGGMGEVWLARETALKRDVALKILRAQTTSNSPEGLERSRKRFEREAAILASCNHPAILPVYISGTDKSTGLRYYSTKACLLDAENVDRICEEVLKCPYPASRNEWNTAPRALSLADLIDGGKALPEASVAKIGKTLVSAVSYAHSLPTPVIHRDIKPANVLFDPDGNILLSDFGIAKKIHKDGSVSVTLTTTSSERKGLFVGTFAYAAPEQQSGAKITPAIDFYSIAALMYEALTGQRPRSLEKPSEFHPGHISRHWDSLLKHMLAPDPARRLVDPKAITEELDAILNQRKRRIRNSCIAIISAAIAFGTVAGAILKSPEKDGPAKPTRTYHEKRSDFLKAVYNEIKPTPQEIKDRKSGTLRTLTLPGGEKIELSWCWGPYYLFQRGHYDNTDEPTIPIVTNTVLIKKGFWISRTEITCAQWLAVMNDTWATKAPPNTPKLTGFPQVQGFLSILNYIGVVSNGVVRLPSDAEWEYACRGCSRSRYEGMAPDDVAWTSENSNGELHPVAQKKPNAFNLFDMHGNAPEWCLEAFAPYEDGPLVNPFIPPEKGDKVVVRGGSYAHPADKCDSDAREGMSQLEENVGFRIVVEDI